MLQLIADEEGKAADFILLIEDLPRVLLFLKPKDGWTLWSAFLTGTLSGCAFRCIGETSPRGYCSFIERQPFLAPHCRDIHVPLCTKDERRSVLSSLGRQYASLRLVEVQESALVAALEVVEREAGDRSRIDSALSLLDQSTARLGALRHSALPDKVRDVQARIEFIMRRLEAALANHEFEKAEFYTAEQRKERENLAVLVKEYGINTAEVQLSGEDVEETWHLTRSQDPQ